MKQLSNLLLNGKNSRLLIWFYHKNIKGRVRDLIKNSFILFKEAIKLRKHIKPLLLDPFIEFEYTSNIIKYNKIYTKYIWNIYEINSNKFK